MSSNGVAIVAILTAGVAGPGITAWATTKGQGRRFRHERYLQDSERLRGEIDSCCDQLDSLIATLGQLGRLITSIGIGRAGEEAVAGVEKAARAFEAGAVRLTISVGPDAPLAAICRRLEDEVSGVLSDLVLIRGLEQALGGEGLADPRRETLSDQHRKLAFGLSGCAAPLQGLRSEYVAAAHALIGFDGSVR